MYNSERLQRFTQGNLPDEEKAALEAELTASPELRAELALMVAVQAGMREHRPPEDAKTTGWDKLAQTIDAQQRVTPANDNRRYSLMHVASVAAAAVLAWQFIVVPIALDGDEPVFTTASVGEDDPSLRLTFAQGADISAITALLREAGGTIKDGPSAIELYTVSFDNVDRLTAAQSLFDDNQNLVTVVSNP